MKFSVTIPAFKAAYLQECIESIIAQTFDDFEIIVVNDNSPEDIDSILCKFDDKRLRYFKNEVGFGAEHVVENWNKCLEYAHGEYVICMGDDDRLGPNCLSDLFELIEKYPMLDVYYSRTELIDEHSQPYVVYDTRPERETVYEMIYNRWHGGSMLIGNYCYRADALRKRGGFYDLPFAWGSDAISAYQGGEKAGIANTRQVGFQYRTNRYSISRKVDNIAGKVRALTLQRKWFENFFSKVPDNEEDRKILCLLRSELDEHFQQMIARDIVYGISINPLKQTRFWLTNSSSYGLSHVFVLKCFCRGIFNFIKNKCQK
ncbi:glycosyltransferase, group 2 family protein [Prevotella sp. BV3P1]|uniref:glycosyltransferase family 2 protein n=1 Tax=Prevotellaceae TaxID=171552 RepID=UPI0003B8854B|nr:MULTISPECIES: glycosyltransferase [Prevotellaceae]ERT59921.1 glycosyltransferase, group 2 family protein [Prevotella sp. BV3P1]